MGKLVTANITSKVTWNLTKEESKRASALWSKCLKINELQVDSKLAKSILGSKH
jgi:hypothetical protein